MKAETGNYFFKNQNRIYENCHKRLNYNDKSMVHNNYLMKTENNKLTKQQNYSMKSRTFLDARQVKDWNQLRKSTNSKTSVQISQTTKILPRYIQMNSYKQLSKTPQHQKVAQHSNAFITNQKVQNIKKLKNIINKQTGTYYEQQQQQTYGTSNESSFTNNSNARTIHDKNYFLTVLQSKNPNNRLGSQKNNLQSKALHYKKTLNQTSQVENEMLSNNMNQQLQKLNDLLEKENTNIVSKIDKQKKIMKQENDIQKLQDYVQKKMLFNLVEKDKCYNFPKDPFNDKEYDLEILKMMRNFKYQNPRTNCKFKERFEIGKVIGQGSYAIVREAIDKIKQQKVAVKIYKKQNLRSMHKLNALRREISILLQLRNIENVVKLIDVYETSNHVNLVMEFCKGVDLY